MTYRCAIHGLSGMGIPDHPTPSIYCDGCGTRLDARTRSGGAPAWLLNGKAPKGWRVEYDAENHTRRDWCPRCKDVPVRASAPGAQKPAKPHRERRLETFFRTPLDIRLGFTKLYLMTNTETLSKGLRAAYLRGNANASRGFAKWIDTFLSEKGIDGETVIEVEGSSGLNAIPVACLVEAMKAAPKSEQEGIKAMCVRLDFRAAPILPYLTHLARAIAQ